MQVSVNGTVQVTFVSFEQSGAPFVLGFCADQTSLFSGETDGEGSILNPGANLRHHCRCRDYRLSQYTVTLAVRLRPDFFKKCFPNATRIAPDRLLEWRSNVSGVKATSQRRHDVNRSRVCSC